MTLDADARARLRAARLYLRAAEVVAGDSAGPVVRALERFGIDPGHDLDLARMVGNPARHYWGWDKAPTYWPFDSADWQPERTVEGNIAKALALLDAADREAVLAERVRVLEEASAKTTRFVRFMDWLIGDLTRAMHGALIAGRENPAEALAFIESCLDHHENLPHWSGTFAEWLDAHPGKPAPPIIGDDALEPPR